MNSLDTAAQDAAEPKHETLAAKDPHKPSAEERVATLLKQMGSHRKALLGIVESCAREPQSRAAVEALVAQLKMGNASVYSASNYCALLERAGAIELVDAVGENPASTPANLQTIVIDGVECLQPQTGAEHLWSATEAGRAALQANQPGADLERLLSDKALYLPVFKRVLALCAHAGGCTTGRINRAVDADPLLQEPRYFASYFTEHLESCGAICWQGTWQTTDLGLETLEALADVEDEYGAQNVSGLYAIETTIEEE